MISEQEFLNKIDKRTDELIEKINKSIDKLNFNLEGIFKEIFSDFKKDIIKGLEKYE